MFIVTSRDLANMVTSDKVITTGSRFERLALTTFQEKALDIELGRINIHLMVIGQSLSGNN